MARTAKFLVRKSLCQSLICREELYVRMRLFAGRSKKFTVPRPPRHFLYKRARHRCRDGGAKRFSSRKASAIALEEGVFVPGLRNSEIAGLDHPGSRPISRRRTEKPATKAGQIWALWPEIEAALEAGQSMKSIRKWLEEDAGITLSITSLTSYISRIRRRLAAKRRAETAAGQIVQPQADRTQYALVRLRIRPPRPAPEHDPLAQAKRVLSQPKLDIRKLHNDGDPEGRNLI